MSQPLQTMTHAVRKEIALRSKKQVDIADLIQNKDISNEDLSNCFISKLYLPEYNLNNTNFSNTKMQFVFNKGVARNCQFVYTHFLPGSSFRAADLRTCNFSGAFAPNIDFAYANLTKCNICDITFTMFSKKAYKMKVDKDFLKFFFRFLDVEGVNLNDFLQTS